MCLLTQIQVWPIFRELAGTEQCRRLWNQTRRRTKSSPELARQGFPCIASHPGCSLLISQQSHTKTSPGILGHDFCSKRKRLLSGSTSLLFFMFHFFSRRRKTKRVKNNSQTLSSCVASLMRAFLKYLSALEIRIWCYSGYEWWEERAGCEWESITGVSVPGESCCLLLLPAVCRLCHTLQLPQSKALCFT